MKRNLFKCAALTLSLAMAFPMFATASAPKLLPVSKPVTLKMIVGKNAAQGPWDKMLVWTEYEKMTGVRINWVEVPEANLVERRNLSIASGDLPDAFFKCNIPAKDIQTYGEQGIFVKLNDLIGKDMPNFQKTLKDDPDVEKGIKTVDGSIYALPYIMNVLSPAITGKMFINKKWIDKLGVKMPTTTNELLSVLTAIKNGDANGNGKTDDEIPLTGPTYNMIASTLRGAWGLGNRGGSAGFLDYDEKLEKVRYWPSDAKYKDFLTYFNRLYKEGLLDQEIFTMNNPKLISKAALNQVGSFSAINHNAMGQQYQDDYEGLGVALKGPAGDQIWSPINSKIWDKGAFAITSKNKNVDVTMAWVDYFYSEEGVQLYFMGKEGVTYKVINGKYDYVDSIYNNPNGLTYDQAFGQYLCWGGNGNPSIATEKYFLGAAMLPIPLKAANNLKPYLPKEIWPQFSYTSKENEKLVQYETDLNSYVNEMTASFITGKTPLTDWDTYISKLKAMKLEEYLKIVQTAYERYTKN